MLGRITLGALDNSNTDWVCLRASLTIVVPQLLMLMLVQSITGGDGALDEHILVRGHTTLDVMAAHCSRKRPRLAHAKQGSANGIRSQIDCRKCLIGPQMPRRV